MFGAKLGDPTITTIGKIGGLGTMLGSGGESAAFIKAIEDAQTEWLEANRTKEGLPPEIEQIILNKVDYIKGMLGETANSQIRTGIYDKLGKYEINEMRTVEVEPAWLNKQEVKLLGNFFQDIVLFGGIKGAPSSPGTSGEGSEAVPDISRISTEIKESFSPEKLHSGGITAGIQRKTYTILGAQVTDYGNEIEEASKILNSQANREAIALVQLYTKMRNLLLILTGVTHPGKGTKKQSTRVHIQSITLFVELIIKEVRKWVETGFVSKREFAAKRLRLLGFSIPRRVSEGPYVRIESSGVTKPVKKEGQVWFTQNFDVTFENLFATKESYNLWTNKFNLSNLLKNLQKIYMRRVDILNYVSGIGRKEEARKFFGSIRDKKIPLFSFGEMNIPDFI